MQSINIIRQSSQVESHECTVRALELWRTAFEIPESIGRRSPSY
jgi:hypothetical protein